MLNKKRNHYIPRFLLNNFASRTEGRKRWVWQYLRDVEPRQVSTRDVAVRSFFYGRDPTIEDSLSEVEAQMKPVVDALVSGRAATEYVPELAQFVYLLAVRTRALRLQIADTASEMATALFGADCQDVFEEALRREAEKAYMKERKRVLKGLPKSQRRTASKLIRRGLPKDMFMSKAESLLAQLNTKAVLIALAGQAATLDFHSATEGGQLEGLAKLLATSKAPDSLLGASWNVAGSGDDRLVLGDSCVFAVDRQGQCGSFFRFGNDEWEQLYLPLTPRHLLVATKDQHQPAISCQRVNEISAQLAETAIFSSSRDDYTAELAKLIGQAPALLSEGEMKQMAREIWRDLAE